MEKGDDMQTSSPTAFDVVKRLRRAACLVSVASLLSAGAARADTAVVATIKPIYSLVAAVMGTTGTPGLVVGGHQSPHTFTMKPSDMTKLVNADVVFRVSEEIEPFTRKFAGTLPPTTTLVTLADAPGVKTLPQREGGPFEPHDDGDHDQGHHSVSEIDGHVWLDPANAEAMVDQITATLAARDPGRAETYKANAAAEKTRIAALAHHLTTELAPIAGKPYVVFHDAYQYFEKRFALRVVGSITVNPDIPPSGRRLSQLREKIAKSGATCVFGEPYFDAKVIRTVTEGTGARTGTLDPEGTSLDPGPSLYETLLETLANALVGCLSHPT